MEDSLASTSGLPMVSVCIPTYKGVTHLKATIDSVLGQSLTDFELIVIDDNSPDGTAELIASYDDPRLRYLKNETNLGPEGNWNRCLEEACGRYFKLLPQDDLIYADTLRQQVEVLQTDTAEEIALVFGARDILDAEGKSVMRRGYPGGKDGRIAGGDIVRRCVRRGTNLVGEPGSVLMRRSLIDTVGPFNGELGYVIDLDYWVRVLDHGDGYYMSQPVSTFRVSPGSWSVAIGGRQRVEYQRFISKLRGRSVNGPNDFDVWIGTLMANINNALRLLFYRFALPKGSST